MRVRDALLCSAAPQVFYSSQLFGSSFIFEPLQYGFGNLFSTYESFDPPSTLRLKCASSRLLTSISSTWCLLPTGLPTLTTRQVSCHNFTAIRCRSQRSAVAPEANLDDSLASRRTAATSTRQSVLWARPAWNVRYWE